MIEKALKQALEALENFGQGKSDVANNLRQAIASLDQEPVAWMYWQSCLN